MTVSASEGIWYDLQDGNPWWPSYHPRRTDVLSWRHAAAILLREIDPVPIFAELPGLFEAIYDQTADAICERLSGTEDRLTWAIWFDVWLEHFDHWNDPVHQLVEKHCLPTDAKRLAQMLTRFDGASFCDFVLDAYERIIVDRSAFNAARVVHSPPVLRLFGTGWPFERLAFTLYQRCCEELDQEPEPAPQPLSEHDFNRVGHPNVYREDAA